MNKSKPFHYLVIIAFFTALSIISAAPCPATTDIFPEQQVYYIRLDIKYENGALKNGKLLMVPAGPEFRAAHFSMYNADGTAGTRESGEVKSNAMHNALENLLLQYGLKSVSSKETLINYSSATEIVMSYEGAVKTPIRIVRSGYLSEKNEYRVELNTLFSPIAFPDQWEMLKRKKKLNDFLSDIKSFFK